MDELQTALRAVLPIFGVMGVGLLIRKLGWLTEEADRSLLRVIVNLLLPCFIFDTALGNPALSELRNLVIAPVLGYFTAALGMMVALSARRLHGLKEVQAQRTFGLSAGLYNYSYMAIPLAVLLFDKATVGVLLVFNVGVEMCIWTLGVSLLTGGKAGGTWRGIVNGPLIAIVVAIAVNTCNGQSHFPAVAQTAVHWVGQCAIPMALIVIGAIIADYLGEFQLRAGWRVVGVAVLLRLVVIPFLFLLIVKFLPISLELKRVLVPQAAMPSAVIPIILSRLHNGDPPTAIRVVISTSVVGLITIPLWLHFGIKYFL
jgi:hypothetical protein